MRFQERVQFFAQVGGIVFHIHQILQAAFNFKRRNACADQVRQFIAQVQVLDREQVAVFDQCFPFPVDELVRQPAVLGTGAAVGRALAIGHTHVAIAAKRYTQRARDKKLQIHGRGFMDGLNLIQVQFPGQHHPLNPRIGQKLHMRGIAVVRLRARVQYNGRQVHFQNRHILNNQRIHADVVQFPDQLPASLQFIVI
jgi:hypothetical protein